MLAPAETGPSILGAAKGKEAVGEGQEEGKDMELNVGEQVIIRVVEIQDGGPPLKVMTVGVKTDGYGDYVEMSDTTLEEAFVGAKFMLEHVRKIAQEGGAG